MFTKEVLFNEIEDKNIQYGIEVKGRVMALSTMRDVFINEAEDICDGTNGNILSFDWDAVKLDVNAECFTIDINADISVKIFRNYT